MTHPYSAPQLRPTIFPPATERSRATKAAVGSLALIVLFLLFLANGCSKTYTPEIKHFPVRGMVLDADFLKQEVVLKQDDVPGFMPAMTMTYTLASAALAEKLRPGDQISAQIAVDPKNSSHYWIENVVITSEADRKNVPARVPAHPLHFGDRPPDVRFVDQDQKIFHLSDLRGKAVLLTFVYTRCPLPNYCPRITSQFVLIHQALKERPALYQKTHLLTISLDPAYDRPNVMRRYGMAYGNRTPEDFSQWTFASTSPADLKDLATAFGLGYYTYGNQISHSLCTILLDKKGRVVQVWEGNTWQWDDVLRTMETAATS